MSHEQRSYPMPTETLPRLHVSHHLEDIVEIRDFLEQRGINTRHTRIERYAQYLRQVEDVDNSPFDASKIFKNAADGPFVTPVDWFLYVLREVHELMWILKGLRTSSPAGVDEKLKIVVSGSDFAALDVNSQSRNTQFELRIASYFCQAGCEVDMSTETDVIARTDDYAFFLECKRVGSKSQLRRRLSEARKQLASRMPRKHGKRLVLGCVAADVTKVAFSHNGLTFGLTNDHSRDVIQEELVGIARESEHLLTFESARNLLCYWLQIHIASLIMKPATTITRFSSYHIPRRELDRKQRKVLGTFYEIFESVSNVDDRALPPQELTRRSAITFPAGTQFSLDEDRVARLVDQKGLPENEQAEIVGTVTLSGENYEFTAFEVLLLSPALLQDWRITVAKDAGGANLQLIARLFAARVPYKEQDEA